MDALRISKICLFVGVFVAVVLVGCAPDTPPPGFPTLVPALSDGFDTPCTDDNGVTCAQGVSLDKWHLHGYCSAANNSPSDSINRWDQVSELGGYLHLGDTWLGGNQSCVNPTGNTYNWKSGELRTNATVDPPFSFVVRERFASGAGVWGEMFPEGGVHVGEIDANEHVSPTGGAYDYVNQAVHYNYDSGDPVYLTSLGFDPSADFHSYRADVWKDKVDFYVDGTKTRTITESEWCHGNSTGCPLGTMWVSDLQTVAKCGSWALYNSACTNGVINDKSYRDEVIDYVHVYKP